MGSLHSSESWEVNRKAPKKDRTQSVRSRMKKPVKAKMSKYKSESNFLEEMQTRPVCVNPLYRHQEMFDKADSFFEEILSKIEQEAAKLSSSERNNGSLKGFDSFMLY